MANSEISLGNIFPIILLIIYGIVVFTKVRHTSHHNRKFIMLKYFVSIFIAPMGLFGFIGHQFMADKVAAAIGWEKGSFFQKEIGFANLAMGISAIYASHLNNEAALKTIVIAYAIFMGGAGFVHLTDLMHRNNRSILNVQPLILEAVIVIYSLYLIL